MEFTQGFVDPGPEYFSGWHVEVTKIHFFTQMSQQWRAKCFWQGILLSGGMT